MEIPLSIEYKHFVRRVRLSHQYAQQAEDNYPMFNWTINSNRILSYMERRKDTFLKARLAPECVLKDRTSSKKPHCTVVCHAVCIKIMVLFHYFHAAIISIILVQYRETWTVYKMHRCVVPVMPSGD